MCAVRDQANLKNIKDGDTISYEMMSFCNNRIFDRLPGLIDIRIVSADNGTTLYDGEYLISVPICDLDPATEYQIKSVEALQIKKKE